MSSPRAISNIGTGLDVERIRADFPILRTSVHGKPLVYFDNAASAQKPQAVIDAIAHCYAHEYANIHRGVHYLSESLTGRYEAVRERIARFVNAPSAKEIVFTRGTTEAINLVAHSFLRPRLKAGDEILITAMEHHSNIVPWQMLCEETGAELRVVPISNAGELDLEAYERLLSDRTKLVGVVHVSNALGTVNPVKAMIELAHARGVPVLVDGAQSVPHVRVDVQALDADFFAFSGHKLYGPTGIGVLYGKLRHLQEMRPYQGGGDMIKYVTFAKTEYADPPQRFEAGTPHIVGVIGLGAAIDYVESVGLEAIAAHEDALLQYATERLLEVDGVRVIGTAVAKAGVLSFLMKQAHPHDIGTILDQEGVALRTGHHCAQPVMDRFCIPATARASFAMYNTFEEVDVFVRALEKVNRLFG